MWNWEANVYRVAPAKPRRWWVNEYRNNAFGQLHKTRLDADADRATERLGCLEVVEVLRVSVDNTTDNGSDDEATGAAACASQPSHEKSS